MSRTVRSAARRWAAAAALLVPAIAAAEPVAVLFVGNSYTFGRVDPVMRYNAAAVHDLTSPSRGGSFANTAGSNPYEPHDWGGVPGIFKQFTVQAGLDIDVSISARNAASLRGHYLNTNPAGWDLLGNVASRRWDAVVLQDLSDQPLPQGRGANANLALFDFYARKLAAYARHGVFAGTDAPGSVLATTEGQLWGGPATGTAAQRANACVVGTGGSTAANPNPNPNPNALSQTACNTARTIRGNPNESTATEVFLYQTWARPDMVYPHTDTVTDPVTGAVLPGAGPATLWQASLESMTADLHDAYFGLAATSPDIAGVAPVGDAFLRAVQQGVATRDPYAPDALTDGLIDLWWDDELHASKYGSYLSALTLFGTLTGLDPAMFGAGERAARDLGIGPADAVALQRIASDQLGFVAAVGEPPTAALAALAGLLIAGLGRRLGRAGGAAAR